VVKDTGIGSGPLWESYKRMKDSATSQFEAVVHRDDGLNPGGGGCHWEPGQSEDQAHCVQGNDGHENKATDTNGLEIPNGGMYAVPGGFGMLNSRPTTTAVLPAITPNPSPRPYKSSMYGRPGPQANHAGIPKSSNAGTLNGSGNDGKSNPVANDGPWA
jgi:hypothetical protein